MISLNKFTVVSKPKNSSEVTFEIGPLPKGFGDTFGVALRRVLLSSIPGSAITSISIEGAEHEFTTLSGLSDDVLEIVLSIRNVITNLKKLEKETLEINIKGKDNEVTEIKAGDFDKNSNVEIINPEYVITRLTGAKAKFKAKVTVERGVGYKMANASDRSEVGVLPLDANFSPVTLVSYTVVPTRVGQETDLDQLNITVQTNGSITSIEAFNIATDILNDVTAHLKNSSNSLLVGNEVAVKLNTDSKKENTLVAEKKSPLRQSLKIEDLNLSTRLSNALIKSNYTDLNQFEGLTEEEVTNIRGMGTKSLEELFEVLKKYSIKLI